MIRVRPFALLAALALAAPLLSTACSTGDAKAKDAAAAASAPIPVEASAATERPIARFVRATGSLTAEEQAEVAAETAGRVVAAPVERGTTVGDHAELVRLSPT